MFSRYTRQMRLTEVGPAGQQALEAASISVQGTGLSADTAVRYVVGAGVKQVTVAAAPLAEAAYAVRGDVSVQIEKELSTMPSELPFSMRDPSAQAVALGAYTALVTLRTALPYFF